MPELTDRAAKQQVEAWMSTHRPAVQGEKDGGAGVPQADSREITPYERQLIESFEREIQVVKQAFINRESELYSEFNQIKGKLQTEKKEYDRIRAKVGDRDPEVYIHPFTLLILCLVSLITLSVLNTYLIIPIFQERIFLDSYFMSLIFDNDLVPVLLGIMMAACNLAIAYYTGRLVRQHGIKTVLLAYMGISALCFITVLVIILNFSGFETKSTLIVMSNLIILLLVTASTYLSYDIEPNYPKVKKKYESLLGDTIKIASERVKNMELHQKLQSIYVEGAQELDKQYRRSVEKVRPTERISIISENILPEFKTVELNLIDSNDLSKYVSI